MFSFFRNDSEINRVADNSNTTLSRNGNTGVVVDNCNVTVSATNSILNIKKNFNTDFKLTDTNIECVSSSNSEISVTAIVAILIGNHNSKIKCNSKLGSIEAKNNSNLKVSFNGSVIKLFENVNTEVRGANGGTLKASTNRNLKFYGDAVIANINNTTNHNVYESKLMEDAPMNKLELSVSKGGLDITNTVEVNKFMESINYKLGFVDTCTINKNQYKVGIFSFAISKGVGTDLKLELNDLQSDGISITAVFKPPSQVHLSGSKDGVNQHFNIIAPQIKPLESNSAFVIRMIS